MLTCNRPLKSILFPLFSLQFSRIVTFRRLLHGYPFTRRSLWKEARIDTLPLYRKVIWASLLGIEHDVRAKYAAIDKETWTPLVSRIP